VHISALVKNAHGSHDVAVATEDSRKSLAVPCRDSGFGSAINGGELLMLALATCYCNDLYREAARLGIAVDSVEVSASADFEGVGLAARNITYKARVVSSASDTDVARLLHETDAVAEIHNTVRSGVPVKLEHWGAGSAV
jgi:organic hydroperoxide reductase OsmC/OhrA